VARSQRDCWAWPPRKALKDRGNACLCTSSVLQVNASLDPIQPGKPQQNAYVERDNRTVRYAWLARTLFDSIEQVQDKATRWLWTYNHERPNMALGGTPMQKLALAA